MPSRILIVVLCCSLWSCKDLVQKYKRSNTGISTLDRKVLYDFRTAMRPPISDPANIPEAMKVINSCNPPIQRVDGSFTYAAEQESAYLWRCGGAERIFVFSGAKLEVSVETPYSLIAGTYDLNHDDKNELLLVGETSHNGEHSREASLQIFDKNNLKPVEDLGIVYNESCALFAGADQPLKQKLINSGLTPYIEAVVVYYLPHSGMEYPNFTAERYRAACPATPNAAPTDWKVVSK